MKKQLKNWLIIVATLCSLGGAGYGVYVAVQPNTPPQQTAMGSVAPDGWGLPAFNPALRLTPNQSLATVEMFDAITVSNIPSNAIASAGYINGIWRTFHQLRSRYRISITVFPSGHAECADVEPLDLTPPEVPAWIRGDILAGYKKPCIYSDHFDFVTKIIPILIANHIPRSLIWEWDANFTNIRHMDPGFDGTQWTDRARGLNLDESTVTLAFLGIAPKPIYPVCYHHRIRRAQCASVKQQVTRWQKARNASQAAYRARGCNVLAQRKVWFDHKIRSDHSATGKRKLATRRAALTATTRTYNKRSCGTFNQRISYFDNRIQKIEVAN